MDGRAVGHDAREALAVVRADDGAGLAVGVVVTAVMVVLAAALVVALVAVGLTLAVGVTATPGVRVAKGRRVAECLSVLLSRSGGSVAVEDGVVRLLVVVVIVSFLVIALVVLVLGMLVIIGLVDRSVVGVGNVLGVVIGLAQSSVTFTQEVGVTITLVALALGTAFDRWTRPGEVDVLALDSLTLARTVDVGDEDRRQAVEALRVGVVGHGGVRGLLGIIILFIHVTLLRSAVATNVDLGAVHVHLAVANLVEPRPSKESLTRWSVRGHGELVLLIDGTATQHGMDDMEVLALVVGEGDLARATPVRSTSLQLQVVGLSRAVVSGGVERVVSVALARVVGAIGRQGTGVRVVLLAFGILVQGAADGQGLAHLHVGSGR